jgi:hypothetical protein
MLAVEKSAIVVEQAVNPKTIITGRMIPRTLPERLGDPPEWRVGIWLVCMKITPPVMIGLRFVYGGMACRVVG